MCYDIYVWIIWISCLKFCLKQQKRQKTISIPARYRYGFCKIEQCKFEIEPPLPPSLAKDKTVSVFFPAPFPNNNCINNLQWTCNVHVILHAQFAGKAIKSQFPPFCQLWGQGRSVGATRGYPRAWPHIPRLMIRQPVLHHCIKNTVHVISRPQAAVGSSEGSSRAHSRGGLLPNHRQKSGIHAARSHRLRPHWLHQNILQGSSGGLGYTYLETESIKIAKHEKMEQTSF